MALENIVVRGAREHNLKNIDITIPRNRLVVITGVSGSGKSSLAFNTIYAEGQRRYVESLSAYARQFLGLMEKPDVDEIQGLSPAISIDQKGASHNPRSTVGTVTEIYDYLRLLFARVGRPHCAACGDVVERQSVQQMADAILRIPAGTYVMILSPLIRGRKGEYKDLFNDVRKAGFVRARIDGQIHDLSEDIKLDRYRNHTVEVIVDRLMTGPDLETGRVADSVETALKLGAGMVQIVSNDGKLDQLYSEHLACLKCDLSLPEIEPRTFSFNSPHGACSTCTGLGFQMKVDPDLVMPNPDLSLREGAVRPWAQAGKASRWYTSHLESLANSHGFSTSVPVRQLSSKHLEHILYGTQETPILVRHRTNRGHTFTWKGTFEGVIPNLERRHLDTESDFIRLEIEKYMALTPCPSCHGKRLRPEALGVTIGQRNIADVAALPTGQVLSWISGLNQPQGDTQKGTAILNRREQTIAYQIVKEVAARLHFLTNIGLDYLSLDRVTKTLSGGEAQRIRLATQIGSGLMGVLYVCDEPSVGLHPIDDHRLIETLKGLRDLGNTILVVEHDESIMREADHLVDLGPGAGDNGGYLVAQGTVQELIDSPDSITGAYLGMRKSIPIPSRRRTGNGSHIVIRGPRQNNLKGTDVAFPLGMLVCITGVSGSGKSSLVYDILYKKLAQLLSHTKDRPGVCDSVEGVENIDKVVNIDQSPIGRTPRSNPATYVGAFTAIRELFATVPESRMRGYQPGRFSFNVKGGRCETCRGEGYIKIEMQFLPNLEVPCEVCDAQRYNREALDIRFKNYNIAQVLSMTVAEALEVFGSFPRIQSRLATMSDVGLGYIRLGQPATTLSGGEAQRVKLSTELSRRATGRTLYILDEPTTGLSFPDCDALLQVLHRLVDSGNSVVLIEHHLDMVKNADWVIDLGPGAGDKGGDIIAEGTPEEMAKTQTSATGYFLRRTLNL